MYRKRWGRSFRELRHELAQTRVYIQQHGEAATRSPESEKEVAELRAKAEELQLAMAAIQPDSTKGYEDKSGSSDKHIESETGSEAVAEALANRNNSNQSAPSQSNASLAQNEPRPNNELLLKNESSLDKESKHNDDQSKGKKRGISDLDPQNDNSNKRSCTIDNSTSNLKDKTDDNNKSEKKQSPLEFVLEKQGCEMPDIFEADGGGD